MARPGTVAALRKHYGRPSPRKVRLCGIPTCTNVHDAHGLCGMHLQRRRAREAAGVVHAADMCQCAECIARRAYAAEKK